MSNTELEKEFACAGRKAAHEHSDSWFAVDTWKGEFTEVGTVLVEYNGNFYEVWLDRTWREAKERVKRD